MGSAFRLIGSCDLKKEKIPSPFSLLSAIMTQIDCKPSLNAIIRVYLEYKRIAIIHSSHPTNIFHIGCDCHKIE